MDQYILGVDIGGSHITAAVLNMESHTIVEKSYTRKKLNSNAKAEEIIAIWTDVMINSCQNIGIKLNKIGMAIPGPFDYEKGISYISGNNKYLAFYGLDVKQMLAEQLGIDKANIRMNNDAACFLAGEVFAGAGRSCRNAIGLTLGTGLGSAVFTDGHVRDANLWCAPFKDGIVEDYLSTRWFLKRYHDLTGLSALNVKDLADWFAESTAIKQIFKEFAYNLADFLNNFLHLTKADAIIIGGNITKAADFFLPILRRGLNKYDHQVPIYISALNERITLIGAASSWQNAKQ